MGYLNKHHGSTLLPALVVAFTNLGREQAKRNAWSGGSYKITGAELEDIVREDGSWHLLFDVSIQERGKSERVESVRMSVGKCIIFYTYQRGSQF